MALIISQLFAEGTFHLLSVAVIFTSCGWFCAAVPTPTSLLASVPLRDRFAGQLTIIHNSFESKGSYTDFLRSLVGMGRCALSLFRK